MFFTQINQLMAQSVDITMVIRKSATGMTVSVLPKSNGLKDEAQNHIVPLTLSGLPEELDAGFMNAIASPVRRVSGLLTNMAEFEKQADKAAANSKASKEQKAKETKEEKEKREKYEKHMKKAEELIAARNHKEAVTALGQARVYATEQNRKTVDEKIEEQKRAMNQGSLFDLMEQAEQQPPQQEVQYVAEQKPVAQQPVGQMPPQQPRQYVQQPPQQPAPQPMQGQQPGITGRHNRRCSRNSRTRIRNREPIPRGHKADSSITGSKRRLITLNGRHRTSTRHIRRRMNLLTGRRITRNTWTSRQT